MLALMNDSNATQSGATNAAIFYQPEGYDTGRQKLMGRHAAGEGFLKGFLRHSDVNTLYCYAANKEFAGHFQRLVGSFGNNRPICWLDEQDASGPKVPGTLYLPDPSLAAAAWRRRAVGQRLYSITGITHTTASAGAMDWIGGLLTAPTQNWDALICTSRVVRDTAELVLERQQEYLQERIGATRLSRPQLPIIPLGVDTEAFAPDNAKRTQARAALGIGSDDIALLFVGRLSFHAKAHPLPMYLGLERVALALAKSGNRKVHLIQAGWFANEFIENAFKSGAAQFCPSVTTHFLDGRKADQRSTSWAAADLFTSLSDNFQETFGLTPIEAMAAGLPGVVSDWNGYKDTVRDGIDGLRIPTLMPRGGLGSDLADRHAAGIDTYDLYCGFSSQFVAIDPHIAARAYMKLIEDVELRKRMGAAARKRAIEVYDWAVVIKQYQALWDMLAELRKESAEIAPRKSGEAANPTRLDPFISFSTYPTDILSHRHMIAATPGADGARLQAFLQSPLISFVRPVAPDPDDCARILAGLQRRGPMSVGDLLIDAPDSRRHRIERGLVWLAKLGLVQIRKPTT